MNKGYGFEIETLRAFQQLEDGTDTKCYRVYGSGMNKNAINMDPDADLDGDVKVEYHWLDKPISVECKHYKPRNKKERSISVKKEWLDQNLEEAEKSGHYSIVAIKFKNTSFNNVHYILPRDHFINLLEYVKVLRNNDIKLDLKTPLKYYSNEELTEEIYRRLNG